MSLAKAAAKTHVIPCLWLSLLSLRCCLCLSSLFCLKLKHLGQAHPTLPKVSFLTITAAMCHPCSPPFAPVQLALCFAICNSYCTSQCLHASLHTYFVDFMFSTNKCCSQAFQHVLNCKNCHLCNVLCSRNLHVRIHVCVADNIQGTLEEEKNGKFVDQLAPGGFLYDYWSMADRPPSPSGSWSASPSHCANSGGYRCCTAGMHRLPCSLHVRQSSGQEFLNGMSAFTFLAQELASSVCTQA